jgi:hypothetical protein
MAKKQTPVITASYSDILAFTGEKMAADAAEAWDEVSQFAAENKEMLVKVGVVATAAAIGFAIGSSF